MPIGTFSRVGRSLDWTVFIVNKNIHTVRHGILTIDFVRFPILRNIYMPYGTFSRVGRSLDWIVFIVTEIVYKLYVLMRLML